jgi:predicted dehydrogenase
MARTFRMGMIGGGIESATGERHRQAIRLTGRIAWTCGAFGSTRHRSFQAGAAWNMPAAHVFGTYRDLFRRVPRMPDGERLDFVTVIAPNYLHYPVAMAAFDVGLPVFCCAPMTTNMDESLNLERKRHDRGLAYGLALPYIAFPLVIQARALVQAGALGAVRKIVTVFPQGWLATRLETAGNKQAGWRTDPRRAGPSCCMTELGIPCASLAEFVSGQAITEVCADLRAFVPGRPLDDDGSVLLHFDKGAHGAILASQVCFGRDNALRLLVWGDKGGLDWRLSRPHELRFTPLSGAAQIVSAESPDLCREARAALRFPADPADPLVAPLALQYDAFADRVAAAANPASPPCPATAEGIRASAFLDAVLRNTHPENTTKWTRLA